MTGDSSSAPLHERRVVRMLHVGSGLVAASSLLWGVVFLLQGYTILAAMDAGLLVMATCTVVLTHRGIRVPRPGC